MEEEREQELASKYRDRVSYQGRSLQGPKLCFPGRQFCTVNQIFITGHQQAINYSGRDNYANNNFNFQPNRFK